MGRRNFKNNKRNPFAQRKRENRVRENDGSARKTEPYEELDRNNESFIKYYEHQKICPEGEWDEFLAAIKTNLPTTFRLTANKDEAETLLKIIKKDFFSEYLKASGELKNDSNSVGQPKCLTWYPNEYAWQLEISRTDIRRSERLFRLHNFLIAETNSGNISRQEAVSMIPPLVLDVQPHHKVLDMCAAPGSKTSQLIESLHATKDGKTPTGFVIANDLDNNRCYMLVHQAKRLNSPCCLITNSDAAMFPSLNIKEDDGKLVPLKFDRVLCDVPCTGDGTMRKNPDIWAKWNLGQSANLHSVQYRVLKRGAELLTVGGRLVYSTCSLNPIENEAVLHRFLKDAAGSMTIIDASDKLPTLKFCRGMTYWEPASKDLKFYKSYEEVPENQQTIIRPHMFPPSAEEASSYNLDKCMRLLPHLQNTGGFFVAVLIKNKPLPWETSEPSVSSTATTSDGDTTADTGDKKDEKPPAKKRRIFGFKEDPYVFFEKEEPIWESIQTYYDMTDLDPLCLFTRCTTGKKKNIYYCSSAVRNIVVTNENNIKIINTGVKTFSRSDNKHMKCPFRLVNEGLANIKDFLGAKRRITLTRDDLVMMLQNNTPSEPPLIGSFSAETQKQSKDLDPGSCILEYKEADLSLLAIGWRGSHSLKTYIDNNQTVHLLRLLGADLSKYETNKFKKNENEIPEVDVDITKDTEMDIEAISTTPTSAE